MKKFLFAMIAFAAVLSFAACNDSETYKAMRDRELDSISSFLRKENIKVISEDEFNRRWKNHEKLTDTAKNNNEWVLFNSNGIYMQVIDQGCGDYIKKGTDVYKRQMLGMSIDESAHILCALNADQTNYIDLMGGGNLTITYNSDRKSTRLNSSHIQKSRMPSSA